MTPLSLLLIIALLAPSTTLAQRPSRRTILNQGEQILEQAKQVKLQNQATAGDIEYEDRVFQYLNFGFQKPKRADEKPNPWDVSVREGSTSEYSRHNISDGEYVILEETQHPEDFVIFIYSKDFPELTTIETVKEEWQRQQRQPDHDNVYEYSHLGFIRELNVIRTDDYTFMGKPALLLEYTFSNWSKFWHTDAIMFPYGKKVYTIKYRRERDEEDKFYEVFEHLLNTFHFLTGEPRYSSFTDVSANHRNSRAIERLKDLGVLKGYEDGSFKPDSTINRAEFVKIITSHPFLITEVTQKCSKNSFSDVTSSHWFAPYVCMAKWLGLIQGYPDGTFKPEQTISFVEAAKIISTFFSEEDISTGGEIWYKPFVDYLGKKKAIPTNISKASAPLTRGMMSEIIYRLHDNITTEDSKSAADF